MDHSITRRVVSLTATQRDRNEEQGDEIYADLYEKEWERLRAEWVEEFGEDNPRFPFRPKAAAIHAAVMKQMADMKQDD